MAENKTNLEAINQRLEELETELSETTAMLETAQGNYTSIVEAVAISKLSKKDLKAVDVEMKRLRDDVTDLENQIAIVKEFKRKAALEELPLIREIKRKKIQAVQKAYDQQAEVIQKKRDELLVELGKLAAIKAKVGGINAEAKQALQGVEGITELSHNVNERHVIAPINRESEGLGISENVQRLAANGSLPSWLRK
ncbi:hypothetical protein CIB87_21340 [Priestia megaterium]|uniref:Uncharacterized protein n=1 Tax=Priestia megaterium TaxID=1404 RepID=A0AA86I3W6_PRIMG|nr:hypothetical protein [Priestia megaterium]AXI31460.1 hypothetical protein CIB87_21340 [Priestia megaterium]